MLDLLDYEQQQEDKRDQMLMGILLIKYIWIY